MYNSNYKEAVLAFRQGDHHVLSIFKYKNIRGHIYVS